MREIKTYVCEICGGSYSIPEIAIKCESYGNPKYYNEFVGKWIILPIQVMTGVDTEISSSVTSSIEFIPIRVESNSIQGNNSYDFLSQLRIFSIAHSLKLVTRSFTIHNVIKEYLGLAYVVPESYYNELNTLLVSNENARLAQTDNGQILYLVKELMEKIAREGNYSLTKPEGVAKYEYNSK